jgi:hypothetical protein
MATFTTTLNSFCEDLKATFPELEEQIARARATTPAMFWRSWAGNLNTLLYRDAKALLEGRKGFLVGPVRLTVEMWSELSEKTRSIIWKYLRTLTLNSTLEFNMEGADQGDVDTLMTILMEERMDLDNLKDSITQGLEEKVKPLIEKLNGLMGSTFADASGFQMPEIPEHLRNGRIAKLAEEMAKQFNPADFGIDPALLTGNNVEEIVSRLMTMYQNDPTKIMAGVKNLAEKIKRQIVGGSLKREDLISEAQEFIQLFKDHPAMKEAMAKMSGLDGFSEMFGSGSSAPPSDRRRAVQERLRRKLAERSAKK